MQRIPIHAVAVTGIGIQRCRPLPPPIQRLAETFTAAGRDLTPETIQNLLSLQRCEPHTTQLETFRLLLEKGVIQQQDIVVQHNTVLLVKMVLTSSYKARRERFQQVFNDVVLSTILQNIDAGRPPLICNSMIPTILSMLDFSATRSDERMLQAIIGCWKRLAPYSDQPTDNLLRTLCSRFDRPCLPPLTVSSPFVPLLAPTLKSLQRSPQVIASYHAEMKVGTLTESLSNWGSQAIQGTMSNISGTMTCAPNNKESVVWVDLGRSCLLQGINLRARIQAAAQELTVSGLVRVSRLPCHYQANRHTLFPDRCLPPMWNRQIQRLPA